MVETENEQKNLLSPSQSLRRKSGAVPVKKFPSLQVSHYPVLLCSHNDDEANQLKSSVIWKASSNTDSPPPFKEAASENLRKTSARANDSSGSFERPLSPNAPALPCSPSRLLPPRKLSFSTVVNMKTAAHNNGLGSPSIRCQSSASPMTASERQLLWNTVHHDSLKSSISMESMYNSCTDLDVKFRQQRKRRAGISSGSAAITRGGAFASAGGSGCNSAGYSTGRSQPPLGGRSPQSSFDSNSNQDVAQISMNWMRMNGLGAGSIRPFLTGNPAVHPKSSHSSTHLSRVGSLRKMHCVTSLEGQLPRSGTQCDGLNAENGEIASRKSVSIAYSNDIEGQKNADDSETPLMEEKEDNSGGRLIKREQLHEKRRITCDRALTFAVLGIVLMMIESELRSNNLIDAGSLESLALKACILGSTLVLIVYVGYFHVIDVQLFMNANAADDWRVSLTTHRVTQILIELMICAVCPLPLELGTYSSIDTHNTLHSLNVLFSISMFFRLYWLCRVMLLHSRLFTDASSRSIAGLNRVNFNARFILKTLMTLCPGKMLIIFTASLWIIAGWILRLCEREMSIPRTRELDYGSSIWLVAITFLSVGYGDIVPHTQCGRVMAVITGILGTCTSSMVVAVITRKLELTRAEKHVHSFMMDTQLTKQLKHSAANVLRETWLIYKYRKLVDKADLSKIRQHQRKFLVAIYELRKVKRDQRKLTENLVSLGDVAKTSSSAYELMHDVHSTQEGLSLRITAIEHQLSDISREIGSLAELIRGRKSSMTSEEASPQHRTRLRTITDD